MNSNRFIFAKSDEILTSCFDEQHDDDDDHQVAFPLDSRLARTTKSGLLKTRPEKVAGYLRRSDGRGLYFYIFGHFSTAENVWGKNNSETENERQILLFPFNSIPKLFSSERKMFLTTAALTAREKQRKNTPNHSYVEKKFVHL